MILLRMLRLLLVGNTWHQALYRLLLFLFRMLMLNSDSLLSTIWLFLFRLFSPTTLKLQGKDWMDCGKNAGSKVQHTNNARYGVLLAVWELLFNKSHNLHVPCSFAYAQHRDFRVHHWTVFVSDADKQI